MPSPFETTPTSAAIPIIFATKSTWEAIRADLPEPARQFAAASGFSAKPGSCLTLPTAEGRIGQVLFGLEDENGKSRDPFRAGALPGLLPAGVYRFANAPHDPRLATLAFALGCYRFGRYRMADALDVRLVPPEGVDTADIARMADAAVLARDLINTPANDMGPAELADAAKHVAARHGARFSCIVGEELVRANFPLVHAVGMASTRAPRLIDFSWGDPAHPKVTLVGKGVCFDSGGLDLKPASGMRLMKKDKAGAAIMLALAQAIIDAGLDVRLRVLLPLVENSVSGDAMRPLDIIRTRNGLTVEIGNTDAEGRLILCDAIAEAASESPVALIDIATLTGAARVALGPDLAALFCNDEPLAAGLLEAAAAEDDPMWRMPLWRPYRKLLDSKVADLNNVSESPHAGAVTAALYLQEFVPPKIAWAHLDAFAWNPQARPGRPEGAEASALRALYAYLAQRFG